ncbi:MAG: 16S rRNA (cytidine(1402)-2'-O)-methyltransferase [Acidobacteria bacterium]|jgi:16S rRNA (cytidine1402-2'-O)-methyltransferase|nr:16S rRNA (cytidine(1402)-2'-O)-methyltransferase [Acidobacteriota bacterium]
MLYLVATPLGNLEDITLRALRILKEADLVACEDTRYTARLLAHYGISTPRESYHKFNEESRTRRFLEMLREGRTIALVSDSGTPLVSDPGYTLVEACRREGIPVTPIPGPSAAIAALVGSGLPADAFLFAGFLPPRAAARRRRLEELAPVPATLLFYESPHRLLASLGDMAEVLGERRACVARELTKIHEEFLSGTLPELLRILGERARIQGEITLVIDRGEAAPGLPPFPDSIERHLAEEMEKSGLPRNEALKSVARQRGITRKEAYNLLIGDRRPVT